MDVTEIFQDFCNNVLRPIIKDAVNEALPKQEITAEEKRYYTVIQAAKLAHVSIATIYRWSTGGVVEFKKIEGRTLLDADEFDAKIRSKRLVRYKHGTKK